MTVEEFEREWLDDKPWIEAHTSGSTGAPKAIRLLKKDMIASAMATNTFFGLGSGDTFVCPLSSDYIAGKMMAVRAWLAGGRLLMLPPANNFAFTGSCSLLAIVPSQVEGLVKNCIQVCRTANIIIGGAPLSDDRRRMLIESGLNAYETYGMTETCSHIALKHISEETFTAVGDTVFSVDGRGCLVAEVPSLSVGRVVTNDIVELTDSRHFRWRGRFDNVINTGAIKVYPEELEKMIAEILHPAYEFCIVGIPDDKWGQTVAIVAETDALSLARDCERLRERLPHHMLPRRQYAVKALTRTANGKIKRVVPEG